MDEVSVHERILSQKQQIVDLWESTGLLRGIVDNLEKEQVALALDSQRTINETHGDLKEVTEFFNEYFPYLKRVSIPIVRRVINPSSFIGFQIGSVQTMMGAEHSIAYRDLYGNIRSRAVKAKTASLQRMPSRPSSEDHNLDAEAEACAEYAEWLVNKMNVEVINDVARNAPTTSEHQWKNRDDLEAHLRMTMGRVEKQGGRQPTWILTTPQLASTLLEQDEFDIKSFHRGAMGRQKVYAHPSCQEGTILVGHKGDFYSSGYFYCPYVTLFISPVKIPGLNVREERIMSRYGKAMPFPEFYGRIQVHGYSPNNEENEEDG